MAERLIIRWVRRMVGSAAFPPSASILGAVKNASTDAISISAADQLIRLISEGTELSDERLLQLAASAETDIAEPSADKIGIHREIGKAIFARSHRLYSGEGLPAYLARYTYPPFISIALSSHCNAACFFCRGSDYKGTTIDFDNIFKLESAIHNARTVDLTGWGEPFFYPQFEEVLNYIHSINASPHLIQVTTNGSFLSAKWGKVLRGRVSNLIISANAGTADTYASQMRYKKERFTFENTIANIREFHSELTEDDRKKTILHMVANTQNFREIHALVLLAADLEIPTVSIGHYICAQEEHLDKVLWTVKEEYNDELVAARELARTIGVNVSGRMFFQGEKEIRGADKCMAPFEQFFVEMPGTTAPCCFMGTERMGNVYEDGFEAIWFSDTMNKLRKNRFLPPCQVCTVFTPFDDRVAHMSAFITTKAEEIVLGGGPELGFRKQKHVDKRRTDAYCGHLGRDVAPERQPTRYQARSTNNSMAWTPVTERPMRAWQCRILAAYATAPSPTVWRRLGRDRLFTFTRLPSGANGEARGPVRRPQPTYANRIV